MDSIFERIIDVVIVIIIFILAPVLYFGQKIDTITQQVISSKVSDFADEVRTKGYITKDMYEDFLSSLNLTNNVYDIKMEHKVLALEPKYRLHTADEVKEEQDSAYAGENVYTYTEVKSDLPKVDDTADAGSLNTETNESILAKAISTLASSSHVHSDKCYVGHRHSDGTGVTSSTYKHGCYTTPGYNDTYCNKPLTLTSVSYNCVSENSACPNCGAPVTLSTDIYYFACSAGHVTSFNGDRHGTCPKCHSTIYLTGGIGANGSMYPCNREVSSIVGYQCTLEEDTTLDCDKIVSSMAATNSVQTVGIGDSLITTVTLTHVDGSTKVVAATTDFDTSKLCKSQQAILTYKYSIDGKDFTKTCTANVSVIPKSKTCPNGHTYNLNTDGSGPGCPYCKAWLKSLEITNPTTGFISIYKGSTLENNGVTLLATYYDGRKEYVSSGYVSNLDTNYVGNQLVTIGYKGRYVYLNVTTKRNLTQCPVCGHFYELYPDGSDPGCPYCKARTPVFTGDVLKYFSATYAGRIIKKLYDGSGIYYFNRGDYFSIKISNKNKTFGTRALSSIIHGVPLISLHAEDGGPILGSTKKD